MIEKLTKREKELLPFLCFSRKEIAKIFILSETTVAVHINSIITKFHQKTKTAALICAMKEGLLKLEEVKLDAEQPF